LLAEHVDLLVLCSSGPGRQAAPPAPEGVEVRAVRAVGRRTTQLSWMYPSLARELARFQPDVVHVVSEPWGLLAVHASLWVRRHLHVALVLHGCDRIWWHGGRLERAAKRLLVRASLPAAAAFCAETMAVTALARRSGLASTAPVAQIHTNPRDPRVFRPPGTDERAASRRRLGLPEHGIGLAFTGRLVPEKGPLLLLEAWAAIAPERRGSAWLVLAGGGPLTDEIRERTAGLASGHFLGQVSFPDGVLDLCRAVEIVAVPSYTVDDWDDQSPRTVIEALLSGALIVGSRSGGIPVMLAETGLLVAEHDAEDLRRGLEQALSVAADAVALARASKESVEQGRRQYSTESVAQQLVQLWSRSVSR